MNKTGRAKLMSLKITISVGGQKFKLNVYQREQRKYFK